MKVSKYNFVFPFEEDANKHVMYNARTGALALIENEKLKAYESFSSSEINTIDEQLKENLKFGGFLIDSNIEEKQLLQYALLTARHNKETLILTVAPTLNCNFRCTYCYEKEKLQHLYMSQEVQDELVNYVRKQANTLRTLTIIWYGGEPLLALDIVENLSKEFQLICKEHNIKYTANMVTNGYLLTPKIVKRLRPLDIDFIQVTLDGPAKVHDERRPLVGEKPTFETIVTNLLNTAHLLPNKVNLRINADRTNAEAIDEIEELLIESGLMNITNPHLGYVDSINDAYTTSLCLSVSEFSDLDFEFKKRLDKHGKTSITNSYPAQRTAYCGADSANSYVVNADGALYKCWNDIGIEEKKVGDLLDDKFINTYANFSYMMYDATIDAECAECKYLPICMGGCPSKRINNPEIRCSEMKYKLDEYMKILPQVIRDERKKA